MGKAHDYEDVRGKLLLLGPNPRLQGSILAERVGFEPTEGQALNGFQDRRFRPLSHLSEIVIITK